MLRFEWIRLYYKASAVYLKMKIFCCTKIILISPKGKAKSVEDLIVNYIANELPYLTFQIGKSWRTLSFSVIITNEKDILWRLKETIDSTAISPLQTHVTHKNIIGKPRVVFPNAVLNCSWIRQYTKLPITTSYLAFCSFTLYHDFKATPHHLNGNPATRRTSILWKWKEAKKYTSKRYYVYLPLLQGSFGFRYFQTRPGTGYTSWGQQRSEYLDKVAEAALN